MDNETPKEGEDFIWSQQTDLQYSPPGRHCHPTEKAVQTYNACFKSTTASLPQGFPISLWRRLTDQVDFAVNIDLDQIASASRDAEARHHGDAMFFQIYEAPHFWSCLVLVKEYTIWGTS